MVQLAPRSSWWIYSSQHGDYFYTGKKSNEGGYMNEINT